MINKFFTFFTTPFNLEIHDMLFMLSILAETNIWDGKSIESSFTKYLAKLDNLY